MMPLPGPQFQQEMKLVSSHRNLSTSWMNSRSQPFLPEMDSSRNRRSLLPRNSSKSKSKSGDRNSNPLQEFSIEGTAKQLVNKEELF